MPAGFPTRGIFNFAQAKRAAADYAARGFDVNLRPSAAFSTLGWFNDPLLSTALTSDSVELAALVFHEIAHNTLWVKGATDFNESFAQWVGYRATADFFLSRHDTTSARRAEGRWQDEQVLGDYYAQLLTRLDSLYGLHLPPAANDSGRAPSPVGAGTRLSWVTVRCCAPIALAAPPNGPINNAALIGVRLYRTNLDLFEAWDASNERDLSRGIYRLQQLLQDAEGPQAFQRMRASLGRPILPPS